MTSDTIDLFCPPKGHVKLSLWNEVNKTLKNMTLAECEQQVGTTEQRMILLLESYYIHRNESPVSVV